MRKKRGNSFMRAIRKLRRKRRGFVFKGRYHYPRKSRRRR